MLAARSRASMPPSKARAIFGSPSRTSIRRCSAAPHLESEKIMITRRRFFSGAGLAVAAGAVAKSALAALPELISNESAAMQKPLVPPNGRPYHPVATLNGWSLPWRQRHGVKEFHLVAEPVIREIAPGMKANLWGYNGQSPGPTLEVVEGDRV